MSQVDRSHQDDAGEETRLKQALRAAAPYARGAILADLIRAELCSRLGLPPSQLGQVSSFMDLGVDSLKAVEIKTALESQLGLPLRSSLLFDYPTLGTLVPFLLERLEYGEQGPPSACAASPEPALEERSGAHGAELSVDQLASSLAEELRAIRSMIGET